MGAQYMDKIEEALSDRERLTKAMAAGVCDALKKHKQAENPVVVWCDGKMVWLKPEEIEG